MIWYYRAYGLNIKSAFELDELPDCAAFGDDLADLTVKIGAVDEADHADLMQLHPQVRVGPGRMWLNIIDTAAYSVTNGTEIVVHPYDGADAGAVALFLLGSCMGAALWQRGLTVLHGNAIKIGDAIIICVGHSGAGKSTLAAEFVRRGYEIISDDVVAVDSDVRALPGIPRIKLWQKSLDHFQIGNHSLKRIRAGEDKFSLQFKGSLVTERLPVKAVFVLQPEDCATPRLEALSRVESLSALFEHSYRAELLKGFGLHQSHFLNCAKIASNAQVMRLRRPISGFQLDALCDAIIRHVSATPNSEGEPFI